MKDEDSKLQSDGVQGRGVSNEQHNEQSRCIKYDLAFNGNKWENICKVISDSNDGKLAYDVSMDGLNPGEVDDSSGVHDTRPIDRNTQLDFTECQSFIEVPVGDETKKDCKVSSVTSRSDRESNISWYFVELYLNSQ